MTNTDPAAADKAAVIWDAKRAQAGAVYDRLIAECESKSDSAGAAQYTRERVARMNAIDLEEADEWAASGWDRADVSDLPDEADANPPQDDAQADATEPDASAGARTFFGRFGR